MARALKFCSSLHKTLNRVLPVQHSISKNVHLLFSSAAYASSMPDQFYNEEQKAVQASFRKIIIENDINPYVDEWEAQEQFPAKELFKKLGNAGLLGVDKPVEYGGLGLDYKYMACLLEEVGSMDCGGVGMGYIVHTVISLPALTRFGSERLKKEFLEPSIKGNAIACLGVSEPGAGSDVSNITTNAVRKGDDLIINGQKMWISNGMQADWICLLANTSEGNRHMNKSLICVPMNSKGITRTKIHKMGTHPSDTAQIFFEDVRVPADNIIGDGGNGFMYQMMQFQDERLGAVLGSLKAGDRAIAHTIDYTRQRKTFGMPIIDNQYVHFRLAELATELESLRALTYYAVDKMVGGEDVTRLASMAKVKAGRLFREISDTCARGFMSRGFVDARLFSIAGGADEIMLGIICKLMDIMPGKKSSSVNK